MNISSIELPTTEGSTLSFASRRGTCAVLLLSNQQTTDAVRELQRDLHGDARTCELPVVQIAHLTSVPRPVRRLAERNVRRGLARQREGLRASRAASGRGVVDPAVLLETALDWNGELTSALGFSDASTQPLVAVLHADGSADPVEPSGDVVAAVAAHLAAR